MGKNKTSWWDTDKVKSVLDDLTHLEINTIVKPDMNATKPPRSPRLLLFGLSKRYHEKLMKMGGKYAPYYPEDKQLNEGLFRGKVTFEGSGYQSFRELQIRAEKTYKQLSEDKKLILSEDMESAETGAMDLNGDISLLFRIYKNSALIRDMLKLHGADKLEMNEDGNFDNKENLEAFRQGRGTSDTHELSLDLNEIMQLRKMYDIGTERILMQTRIGLDGDVTTRIAERFADRPVEVVNVLHHEAINISVRYWKGLIDIVKNLGSALIHGIGKS